MVQHEIRSCFVIAYGKCTIYWTLTQILWAIKSDALHTALATLLRYRFCVAAPETIEFDEIFQIKFNWSQPNRDPGDVTRWPRLARRESQRGFVHVFRRRFFSNYYMIRF